MRPVGFEPTISVGERSQTHALDRAATGKGQKCNWSRICNKTKVDLNIKMKALEIVKFCVFVGPFSSHFVQDEGFSRNIIEHIPP